MNRSLQVLGAMLLAGCSLLPHTASAAQPSADVAAVALIDTGEPGGFFGYWGFDLYTEQSVGARFTVPVDGDYKLTSFSLWLMNNSDTQQGKVKYTLQTDALDEGGLESVPSGVKLEGWNDLVDTYGWTPVQQSFKSQKNPELKAGHNYWIVAASKAKALKNPVWVIAAEGLSFSSSTYQGAWQTGGTGAAPTIRVEAKKLK